MRARHQLSKFLLRKGHVDQGKTTWSRAHSAWLDSVGAELGEAEERFVYGELRAAVATLEDRRRRIDAEISRRAASPELSPVVTSMSGIRGVSTLTAFAVAVERGDLSRFRDARVHVLRRPRAVGVVERRVDLEGALTKTGNAHVRRLLVEAAWHHERPLNASSRAQARSVVR